jgi:23S rRNA (adenine2503-C2)-methyltransferase
MEIVMNTGRLDLAQIYVAKLRNDPEYMIEFVDACDSSVGDRSKKWVIVLSTQFGCPVNCLMCDAGGSFKGNLSFSELKFQVESVFAAHEELNPNSCEKLKIQFARMGEPSLNDEVLDFLMWLKDQYPNVIPCLATIIPRSREQWFARLLEVRDHFSDFQLQFSINSSDTDYRDWLMPFPKMEWEWLGAYGKNFFRAGQRKIALNFAICPEIPVQAAAMRECFDPAYFLIKLTPVNPTGAGFENRLTIAEDRQTVEQLIQSKSREFEELGFRVIQSIGNMEENLIGSNCGQAVRALKTLEFAAWQ